MEQIGENSDIYQLINLTKEIPGSNICYQNTEGIILWNNNHLIHDLKRKTDNIIGKKVFDLFSSESAKLCWEEDLAVVNSRNMICKQQNLQLINGEMQEYFITRRPWMIAPDQVGGVIINAINIKQTLCKQFNTCYANNQLERILEVKLQKLYFNFKQPLKEIFLLTNLIMSGNINKDVKSLCVELKNFAKRLISYCNDILDSKKIVNTEQ